MAFLWVDESFEQNDRCTTALPCLQNSPKNLRYSPGDTAEVLGRVPVLSNSSKISRAVISTPSRSALPPLTIYIGITFMSNSSAISAGISAALSTVMTVSFISSLP